MSMRFEVVTLFDELVVSFCQAGLLGRALDGGLVQVRCENPRNHALDRHKSVDDAPFGGGSGMVMRPEPLVAAMDALDAAAEGEGLSRAHRVLLTPQGQRLDQATLRRFATLPAVMLVCGRYEGVDERVALRVDSQVSLGDFVLNGGEVAALAIIEATTRLLPGVLGNEASLHEESHEAGLLEYPHYTRPRSFDGDEVPQVLLNGNHAHIARWRRTRALLKTRQVRPDLFEELELSDEDRALLEAIDEEAPA